MKLYLSAAFVAFLLSLAFCLLLIPVLRKIGIGQNILSYVKEHKTKSGTPTMGGLAFILAAVFAAALFMGGISRTAIDTVTVGLAYMAVGFLDDFLKKRRKENLGLRAYQKFGFQLVVAVFAAAYAYRAGLTELYLPFFNHRVDLGGWTLPLVILLFLSTVNAVNLTDGLDGLAAGVSIPYFLCFGIVCLLTNGESPLSLIAFCLVGALAAYLLFNSSPASVFMGDTGSLALGGFASCIAAFSGNALFVLLLGIMFVFSVISVVLQVIYYKATKGKRIFLMSPVHHHFQQKGYSASKIAYAYSVLTAVMGALCIITVL